MSNRGTPRHLPLSNAPAPPRPPTSQGDRRDTSYASTQAPSPVALSPPLSSVAFAAQSPQPNRSGTVSSTHTAQRVTHSLNSSSYIANTTHSEVAAGTGYPNVMQPTQQINNHITASTTTISEMKMSKEELRIIDDSTEEITKVATTEILNSVSIGGNTADASGKNVSEHFLEIVLRSLHANLDKWKTDLLYPAVDEWVKKNLPGHIKKLTKRTVEKTCQMYEAKITVIKEKYDITIREMQKNQDEYLAAVQAAWRAYELKMKESVFVGEIKVRYRALEEQESWGSIFEKLEPKMAKFVPPRFETDFTFGNSPYFRTD